jgi:hypothetical protein
MKEITTDQVRRALDVVMNWPPERQENFVNAVALMEEQYNGEVSDDKEND